MKDRIINEIRRKYSKRLITEGEDSIRNLAQQSRANLYNANLNGANLSGADLNGADLCNADLSGANLYNASLYGANLSGANLSGANLSGADLNGADLNGADLNGANFIETIGINPNLCTPLLILKDQIGKIRAYKLVNNLYRGPFFGGIKYEIGKTYTVKYADCSVERQCSFGISLATLDWCIKNWKEGYHILIVEFTSKNIAAIPTATDGKFRVYKCKVVGEKDLKEIGLIK